MNVKRKYTVVMLISKTLRILYYFKFSVHYHYDLSNIFRGLSGPLGR